VYTTHSFNEVLEQADTVYVIIIICFRPIIQRKKGGNVRSGLKGEDKSKRSLTLKALVGYIFFSGNLFLKEVPN